MGPIRTSPNVNPTDARFYRTLNDGSPTTVATDTTASVSGNTFTFSSGTVDASVNPSYSASNYYKYRYDVLDEFKDTYASPAIDNNLHGSQIKIDRLPVVISACSTALTPSSSTSAFQAVFDGSDSNYGSFSDWSGNNRAFYDWYSEKKQTSGQFTGQIGNGTGTYTFSSSYTGSRYLYVFIPAAYVASSVDMEDNTEWFITTNLGTAVKDTIKDYDLAFASAADKFILKGNNNSSLASAT